MKNRVQDSSGATALERLSAGGHLIHHHTKAEDITPLIHFFPKTCSGDM